MTTKKQTILLNRMKVYLKRLGMIEEPKIIWTLRELIEQPKNIVGRRASKNTLGECYFRSNLIYIAYNKHHSLSSLDNTLRHELIHYRFSSLNHGPKFELRMKELKKGKTWPKYYRVDYVKGKKDLYVSYQFRRFNYFISNLKRISESNSI